MCVLTVLRYFLLSFYNGSLGVLRYLRPFFINVLILSIYLLSVYLVVSHYDLQPVQNDHNGNKRNHFLFFVLSLVLVSKL